MQFCLWREFLIVGKYFGFAEIRRIGAPRTRASPFNTTN